MKRWDALNANEKERRDYFWSLVNQNPEVIVAKRARDAFSPSLYGECGQPIMSYKDWLNEWSRLSDIWYDTRDELFVKMIEEEEKK